MEAEISRNGSGTYTAPSNSWNPSVVDTTIDEDDFNTLLTDIEAALTASLAADGQTSATAEIPFANGIATDTVAEDSSNTGVTVDGVLLKDGRIDWDKGADVASASAPDIWGTTGMVVDITGTTTITDFADAPTAGITRFLQFDGALTFTHGSGITLPGGANITTAAGDTCIVYADTTTAFVVLAYQRASGEALVNSSDVITTRGDVIRGDSSGDPERLALGTSGYVLTSDGTDAAWAENALPSGHLNGCILSNDTDTDHDINVTAGTARDAADGVNLVLSSEITKRIDATWSAGDDAGGLSSSLTAPANDTWYHVFLIVVSGSVDVGFDTSLTAANLVSDHSATVYRRIGSVLTDGSANIIAFRQAGDRFYWDAGVADYTEQDPGASEVTTTLSVPTGLSVGSIIQVVIKASAATTYRYTSVYHPDMTTPTPSAYPSVAVYDDATTVAAGVGSAQLEVPTDTSAQIQHISDAEIASVFIVTVGWEDDRGRN